MATFRVPMPEAWLPRVAADPEDAADAVKDYLATQGITAEVSTYFPPPASAVMQSGSAIVQTVELEAQPPAFIIDAETDPTPMLMNGWSGGDSIRKTQLKTAKTLALTYRDKVINGESVTALESARALAAAITLIEFLARTD